MDRVRRGYALLTAPLLALALALSPAPALAQAAPRPVIQEASPFGAPIDAKGGVQSPYVSCSEYRFEPRVRWVLKNPETGYSHTAKWRGALPAMSFPRVKVGTYRSITTAWCRGNKARRVQSIEVVQKTAKTTMSRTEFRRIKRGMSPERVRRIVGYRGRAGGSHAGETMRTYDIMPFWHWSVVVFKNGHVTGKRWDVPH